MVIIKISLNYGSLKLLSDYLGTLMPVDHHARKKEILLARLQMTRQLS